ncbi:membrane associated rhomboid family serine protease [Pedobacter sp. AK013]|uniref:rhomboid family intramembrane serine protease n=1 Tax=Pedobacter sp. AK013 TaxID=2723071 RepID=UPI0016149D3E|nr:rhomboid family intramembrane serine protease [Pedobacter sp. AK013]MBB6239760.1 membrane associated rhomboid family serine protease [Pedobacter sp. AK013]
MIILIALSIPNVIAQNYLPKVTGKLTLLFSINEIDQHKPSKYYTLKKFNIDKNNIGVNTSVEVSGRNNENFNIYIFVVLPIIDKDVKNDECKAFLGVKYSKHISNRLTPAEKQENYETLLSTSQYDVEHNSFNEFRYLEQVGNSSDKDGYKAAILHCIKYDRSTAPVLIARKEPFEDRLGNQSNWIFISFGILSIIWLIMVLIPKIDRPALRAFESGTPIKNDDLIEFLRFLQPKNGFYLTPILVFINILLFLTMVISGLGFINFATTDLLTWGANFGPFVKNGEWWRLITNTFLHGGIMHILTNMIGLIFLGFILEMRLGKIRFLLSYLFTGIMASLASIWWNPSIVSVGASGAIFGLSGIFLALLVSKFYDENFTKSFLIGTLIFIGYNLFYGLTGGIDNAAHIGGLISGFILGLIFRFTLEKPVTKKTRKKRVLKKEITAETSL